MQFAVFKIGELAAGIPGITIVEHLEVRALGQRHSIEFDHMGAGVKTVQTVLAFAIRDGIGPIVQIDAHARDAFFVGVLNPVVVTVRVHLAD